MGEIAVIVNPLAGGNLAVPDRASRLQRILGGEGRVWASSSLEELAELGEELRRRPVDLLAVCGGDGTFFRSLTAVLDGSGGGALPAFLPLRAGSMNTIMRGLGCARRSPEDALGAIVRARREARPLDAVDHQLLSVNGALYGFIAGAGTIATFLQAYERNGRLGPSGAARLVLRLAASALGRGQLVEEVFRWAEGDVRCDGEPLPFRTFSLLYASTIQDIGLGFRPTYRAMEQPGHFQILAGPLPAREIVLRLHRFWLGRPAGSPRLADRLAARVEIEFARPEPYMIDGDVLAPIRRLEIIAGPAIKVIRREA